MITIALAGFGLVGKSFYELVKNNVDVKYVIVKNIEDKNKSIGINFTNNFDDVINDKSIEVVVECISDPDKAFDLISSCLGQGKDVVTCNKILIKTKINQLSALADKNGATIYLSSIPSGSKPKEFIFPMTHNNFQSQMHKMPFIFRGGGAHETSHLMRKDLMDIIESKELNLNTD